MKSFLMYCSFFLIIKFFFKNWLHEDQDQLRLREVGLKNLWEEGLNPLDQPNQNQQLHREIEPA
jgi:hypothetical protein